MRVMSELRDGWAELEKQMKTQGVPAVDAA